LAPSKIITWIEAARPKTLAAAFVPVLVGSAIAYNDNSFDWLPSSVALLCAFLIQKIVLDLKEPPRKA
jgi:1,4-dihydroxy-2-naphthoate octaprenyltransferase